MSFFTYAVKERLGQENKLVRIEAIIDWQPVKEKLAKIYKNEYQAVAGVKPYSSLSMLKLFNTLMAGVYDSRSRGHPESIMAQYQDKLNEFKEKCAVYKECGHEDTEKLAKEFLNDWNAIFRVLDYHFYPLTNNEAERALRHWVIVRKLTQRNKNCCRKQSIDNFSQRYCYI